MKDIILFRTPSRVFRYKFFTALVLAMVPVTITIIGLSLLLVFTKLNLYHIEAMGVIINSELRQAYYDQVISDVSEVLPEVSLLVLAVFVVSFIVMNWATSPFERARRYLENSVFTQKKKRRRYDMTITEDPIFDTLVREFCDQVCAGTELSPSITSVLRPSNARFLVKFALTFIAVSFLSGMSLTSLFFVAYNKIISLSIQLVQAKQLSGHYFNAQQEILTDTLDIAILISLFIYFWMGRQIYRYMSLNLYAFSKAISENRFPIAMRRTEVYHELADTINLAYIKHKHSRL